MQGSAPGSAYTARAGRVRTTPSGPSMMAASSRSSPISSTMRLQVAAVTRSLAAIRSMRCRYICSSASRRRPEPPKGVLEAEKKGSGGSRQSARGTKPPLRRCSDRSHGERRVPRAKQVVRCRWRAARRRVNGGVFRGVGPGGVGRALPVAHPRGQGSRRGAKGGVPSTTRTSCPAREASADEQPEQQSSQ